MKSHIVQDLEMEAYAVDEALYYKQQKEVKRILCDVLRRRVFTRWNGRVQ